MGHIGSMSRVRNLNFKKERPHRVSLVSQMVKKERTPHRSLSRKLARCKKRRDLREPGAVKHSYSEITRNRSGKAATFLCFRDHVVTALSPSEPRCLPCPFRILLSVLVCSELK